MMINLHPNGKNHRKYMMPIKMIEAEDLMKAMKIL